MEKGGMSMPTKLPMEKLQLLYLIEQTRSPVSREDLWEFCEPWYSYFPLQSALSDLFNQGLIKASAVFTAERRYEITDAGVKTLEQLYREIPLSKRNRLEQDAQRMRDKARMAVMYLADYHKVDRGQYIAELRIIECGLLLLNLGINLPTLEQADALCKRWTQAAPQVYESLLRFADPRQAEQP
jgi:DNA-binding PadR family transcriptional regulator